MIHFISGLPRSGSTLLASLLNQNPRFSAHVQSPLGQIITTVVEAMSAGINESALFLTGDQREEILRGIFSSYYLGYPAVVFDTNRRWCANMGLVARLFPDAKVIACVRPPAQIVDSFERLFARDPTQVSRVLQAANMSIYDRVNRLMHPASVVGFSWNALRDGYFGPYAGQIVLLEFQHLVNDPLKALRDLHAVIDEPWYEYDIRAVQNLSGVELLDWELGTPGMHSLKPEVDYIPVPPMLPADIAMTLPAPFWLHDDQEDSGVKSSGEAS
jgi:sulfotransferase